LEIAWAGLTRLEGSNPSLSAGGELLAPCHLEVGMRPLDDTVERKLARIAGKQHGIVTRQQLLNAGISDAGIQRRVRKGTLLLEYRGIYRVGHRAPSVEARYLAAVLACGEEAVLVGRAAAYAWGLVKGLAPSPEVAVSVRRQIKGIRTRRIGVRAVKHRGIPIATSPRSSSSSRRSSASTTWPAPATRPASSTGSRRGRSRPSSSATRPARRTSAPSCAATLASRSASSSARSSNC
jgi:hypothetical protein